jgi:toxin FitB
MIVLDTNVISELMRAQPDPHVVEWVDQQRGAELFLTAITVSELLYGVARLPAGRRKTQLAKHVEALIAEDFDHRVAPFDETAAVHYADITSKRERSGRAISMADAQIAATCRSYGAILATRNTADFADTGLVIVDPWVRPPG